MTPEKDPSTYPLITYAWVIGMSLLGGIVSFLRKVKRGHARPFNLAELIGEIITSALVGMITFYLCESSGINQLMSAAMIGIASHMGSRALFVFERLFERMVAKWFGVETIPEDRGN